MFSSWHCSAPTGSCLNPIPPKTLSIIITYLLAFKCFCIYSIDCSHLLCLMHLYPEMERLNIFKRISHIFLNVIISYRGLCVAGIPQFFTVLSYSCLFCLKFPVLQENLDVYLGLQQFIVTTSSSKLCLTHWSENCYRINGRFHIPVMFFVFFSPYRSEAECHSRERLPSPSLFSQGPQFTASSCRTLGWTFHWRGFCCTFHWCTGIGGEVSVLLPLKTKTASLNISCLICNFCLWPFFFLSVL